MNTTVRQLGLFSLLLMAVSLSLASWFASPTKAQDTAQLRAVCETVVSENTSLIPSTLTATEFCKAIVAVLASEWDARGKIQAAILLVNNHEGRLTVHHQRLAVNEAAIAELQATDPVVGLQQQIDFINSKLASVANVLQ